VKEKKRSVPGVEQQGRTEERTHQERGKLGKEVLDTGDTVKAGEGEAGRVEERATEERPDGVGAGGGRGWEEEGLVRMSAKRAKEGRRREDALIWPRMGLSWLVTPETTPLSLVTCELPPRRPPRRPPPLPPRRPPRRRFSSTAAAGAAMTDEAARAKVAATAKNFIVLEEMA
jgi:hypothetical protein